ncbi:hypothetical protein [Streptomyces sp. NPDC097619]|uniref:hypothetical protein n=1 Tax=Streptomyces sp. NPDC097619 TaxID=3157228 RepID=UPI00333039F2
MNRTRLTEVFTHRAHGLTGAVVASRFAHPVRGPVACPAAPLLGAWLADRLPGVRYADLIAHPGLLAGPGPLVPDRLASGLRKPVGEDREAEAGRILAAVTYLDGTAALGLAVATGDPGAARLAREAVAVWSRAMRTRRVFLPTASVPCGARPTVAPVPASRTGTAIGAGAGAGATPVTPPGAEGECGADRPPCPASRLAERAVRAFHARGDTVVMVGDAHPGDRREEARGGEPGGPGKGRGPAADPTVPGRGPTVRVGTPEEAGALPELDGSRLSYVVRPCAPVEEAVRVVARLRELFPLLRGQHPEEWCYRASDAAEAIRSAAAASDLVVLLGASRGTAEPAVRSGGGAVVRLSSLADLRPELLAPAATVTVVEAPEGPAAGGPTATGLARALSGLGPVGIVRRTVTTRPEPAFPMRPEPAFPEPSVGPFAAAGPLAVASVFPRSADEPVDAVD